MRRFDHLRPTPSHFNMLRLMNLVGKTTLQIYWSGTCLNYEADRHQWSHGTATQSKKTSETISDSAECYAGLTIRFESSAACM